MLQEDNHKDEFQPAYYTMITGDKSYSPFNESTLKYLNDKDNINGEK